MRLAGNLRPFLLALALAAIAYVIGFSFIQHRRSARGPWEVTFASEANSPSLVINQTRLGITNVRIAFTGTPPATNITETVRFTEPHAVPPALPFGKCVFLDLLFQPGTVVLEAFGHQIQLMPRALTVDHVERAWRSGETITLTQFTNTVTP